MNNLNNNVEIVDIIQNAIIIYTDGISEFFDAIRVTDKGVIIGRILEKDKTEEFIDCGFISNRSIKKIKKGTKIKIVQRI